MEVAVKVNDVLVLTLVLPSNQPSNRQPLFGVARAVTDAPLLKVPPPDTEPPLDGEAESEMVRVCCAGAFLCHIAKWVSQAQRFWP